jgi:hypothetical protein
MESYPGAPEQMYHYWSRSLNFKAIVSRTVSIATRYVRALGDSWCAKGWHHLLMPSVILAKTSRKRRYQSSQELEALTLGMCERLLSKGARENIRQDYKHS